MRFRRLCAILVLLLMGSGPALAQPSLQYADLGTCSLTSGETIQDCRIGYRTAGTLNADRSNAVLVPTWFTGTSGNLVGQLGPEGLVDTTRYFAILVDALGNGVSASPSTSTAQPDSTFPVFSIRDMVDTQHRLLSETLNIDSLHAVVGISMGGMQAFVWMTQYPAFADTVVPIVGTPRLTPQDRLLWCTELRALRTALDGSGSLRQAQKTVAAVHALHLRTPESLATMDSQDYQEFLREQEEYVLNFAAYDWARQLQAMLQQNIFRAFDGSAAEAASTVTADVLVVTVEQDHMVNPTPAQRFADRLGADQLTLETPCGHLGTGCKSDTINMTVRRFLGD